MKRFLMLVSFVGGLFCASLWMQNSQLVAQQIWTQPTEPIHQGSKDRPRFDSPPQPLALSPPSNQAMAQMKSLPRPKLPNNEALEQQQAFQDIMELRQRYGSVVSNGDDAFAELVQHLVKDDQSENQQENNQVGGKHSHEFGSKREFTQQLNPQVASPPAISSFQSSTPPVTTLLMPNNPVPARKPMAASGHRRTLRAASPQNTFSYNSADLDRVKQIRKIARQLDKSASDLEDIGEYASADQIRSRAQALRESCR